MNELESKSESTGPGSRWAPWAALVAAVGLVGARVGGKLLTHADDIGRAVVKSSDELGEVVGRQSDEVGAFIKQADESDGLRLALPQVEDLGAHLVEEGLGQVASATLDGWLDDEGYGERDSPLGSDPVEPASESATTGPRTLTASVQELELYERYTPRSLELPDGVMEFRLTEKRSSLRLRHVAADGSEFDTERKDTELPGPDAEGFARFRLAKWGDKVRCVKQLGNRLPSGRMNVLECIGELGYAEGATWEDVRSAEKMVKLTFTEAGNAAFASGLAEIYRRTAEGKLGPRASVEAQFTAQPRYEITIGPDGLEFAALGSWRLKLSGTY